jgi:hypothetical protein
MTGFRRALIVVGLVAGTALIWRLAEDDSSGSRPPTPASGGSLPALPGPSAPARPSVPAIGGPVDCDSEESRHGIKRMYEETVKALDGCPEFRERTGRRGRRPPPPPSP